MTCAQCERLWRVYEAAVFEHVRLGARLKLAQACNDEDAVRQLAMENAEAEARRGRARDQMRQHEGEFSHGEPAHPVDGLEHGPTLDTLDKGTSLNALKQGTRLD